MATKESKIKQMNGAEVRRAFLDFFRSKDHTEVASSSLVPQNDPTLLFSNAGMNQFKDCFLGGERRSYVRATTCQKCLRISGKHNDLENVGVTARHHTFFEMLGNFSFGDYFKRDAILFAWEFVTEVLRLNKARLWVTIYEKDDEAFELWKTLTDIDPQRILRLGEKDNFWAMGDTGPCGPCSEIHYYIGPDEKNQSEAGFRADDGQYLEFWNLVFMQFNRAADGALNPLPKPAVDTGMGLERITSILQSVKANYDTDLLRPVITLCEQLSGFTYDGSSYVERDLKNDLNYARDVAMRVVADHARAIAFLIADGVHPASDGRGYVLRRLLRRAARYGRVLNFSEPFLAKAADCVVKNFGEVYPELRERRDVILKVVDAEERKFYETLDAGLAILQREVAETTKGSTFSGDTAFLLHDTYGFPLDLTADVLKSHGLQIDSAGFDKAMAEQKKRSRDDRKAHGISFVSRAIAGPKTEFLGYERENAEARLVQLFGNDEKQGEKQPGKQKSFSIGDRVTLVFDATPFYAEAGGQVGDTGQIRLPNAKLRVEDTQKVQDGFFLHNCILVEGSLDEGAYGQKAELAIDAERRAAIRVNHSATHLLHAGLRRFLGEHVKQAGSRVDEDTLRFDYSHFQPLSEQQLIDIQGFVNDEARQNYEVDTKIMTLDEAKESGAMALFGEKYGAKVRVVAIGPNSLELCGGTHARRSGEIGFIHVVSEGGISSGVRRIECHAGSAANSAMLREKLERLKLMQLVKSGGSDISEKVERLMERGDQLERELAAVKGRLATLASDEMLGRVRTTANGRKVIAEKIDSNDAETLRTMVDRLRQKLGSGVVALGAIQGDKAIVVAGVTADLTSTLHAGNLVKEASKLSGGKGGGRADFAQAGGVEPSKLGETLGRLFELVSQ